MSLFSILPTKSILHSSEKKKIQNITMHKCVNRFNWLTNRLDIWIQIIIILFVHFISIYSILKAYIYTCKKVQINPP